MSKGIRRKARGYALQVLYAADVGEHDDLADAARSTNMTFELELAPEGLEFARVLVGYVDDARDEIDGVIQRASKNWRLERMARVDRNILRLAVAELKGAPDVPRKVVINEAVELAKTYSAEGSPAFVNGILDRIASDLKAK